MLHFVLGLMSRKPGVVSRMSSEQTPMQAHRELVTRMKYNMRRELRYSQLPEQAFLVRYVPPLYNIRVFTEDPSIHKTLTTLPEQRVVDFAYSKPFFSY